MSDIPRSQKMSQIFNLREGEEQLVRQLFFHNFFQGVGIAFFFTAANTLFLDFFSVKYLPWVYLLSAVLLLVLGRAYAYYEHHWPLKKLMTYVVGTLILVPIIFYAGLAAWQQAGVIFMLMAFHRVLYTLNSLEFWGLSSLAFNVRQSKRIFPLIGAGDIPAKLLGYLAVTAIVPYTGIEALLLIAASSFVISYIFLRKLVGQKDKFFQGSDSRSPFATPAQSTKSLRLNAYFKSPLIFWISLLSVTSLIALTLLDYAFLMEVKYSFKEKKDLAQFFGLLFSIGYTLILVSKFIFSGRVIERLGVVRSSLVLPVFLFLATTAALIIWTVSGQSSIMLWVFSAILIGVEMARYTIDEPNLMTLFQPLSKSLRLHGHTLVKTIMNPAGLLFAGLILLGILQWGGSIDLMVVSVILWAFSALMILIGVNLKRHYLSELYHSIRTKYFEGATLTAPTSRAFQILEEKVNDGEGAEAIHSLRILSQHPPQNWEDILSAALNHREAEVRAYAVDVILQHDRKAHKPQLIELLRQEEDEGVLRSVIAAIPAIAPEAIEELYTFIDHLSAELKSASIMTLLNSGQLDAETRAGQFVLDWLDSHKVEDQVLACRLIESMEEPNNFPLILPLFQSPHREVKSAAISAAGEVRHPFVLQQLFVEFFTDPKSDILIHSLAKYGDDVLMDIKKAMEDKRNHFTLLRQSCYLLALIKSPRSLELLFQQVQHPIAEIRGYAVELLYREGFSVETEKESFILRLCDQWLIEGFQLLQAEESEPHMEFLFRPERKRKAQELLMLLSFVFSKKKIQRIRESLAIGRQDSLAKAIEVLEYEVPRSVFTLLELLLDPSYGSERLARVQKIKPDFVLETDCFSHILQFHWHQYSRWVTGRAILECGTGEEYQNRVIQLSNHPSSFICQQAQSIFSAKKITGSMKSTDKDSSDVLLLQIEKILLLKNTKLFQNIPDRILVDVADIVREMECSEGENLFQKGDMGSSMFIIASGSIRIHDGGHIFTNLKKHDIFGELVLLSPEPRSASATAAADSLLLCIDQAPFFELISTQPEVTQGIMQRLAELLRNQNEEILEMKRQLQEK